MFHQLLWIQPSDPLERFHHIAVFIDQLLQRLTGDTRSMFVDVQVGIFQRGLGEVILQRLVILEVLLLLAALDLVQRRLGDVDVPLFDQLRHLTEEERQQQGADMRTVNVGVRHDDDVVVAQLVDIEFIAADTATERGNQRADLLGRQHAVEPGLLNVKDLTLERQDGLGLAVAALLRRTARRVTFHNVEFRQGRVSLLAVGELAGQAGDVQRALAAGHLPSLACSFTGAGSIDHLAHHRLGLVGPLQQIIAEELVHFLFDRCLHFRGNQLVLRLGGKLGIGYLDRDDRCQSFSSIVTGGTDLELLQQTFLLDIVVQAAGEGAAEASQVGTTVALGNIVGKAQQVFIETVVPLHRNFHGDAVVTLHIEMEYRVHSGLVDVEVLDKRAQPAFVAEQFTLSGALIHQIDAYPGVEERQLPQPLGQYVPAEADAGERLLGRLEVNLSATGLGFADDGQGRLRDAVMVGLLPYLAAAEDGHHQLLGKSIDHGRSDTVETPGARGAVVIELAAGVQHGHDHFRCGHPCRVNSGRNTAAVVLTGDRLIGMDGNGNVGAVPGRRLVDRVVHHLEYHVVQTRSVVRVADIHAGAFTHRIKAFQHLDT